MHDGVTEFLVSVKDVEALARAMVHLLNNPAMRERMGRTGREKMQPEVDERIVVEQTLKVYQQGSL